MDKPSLQRRNKVRWYQVWKIFLSPPPPSTAWGRLGSRGWAVLRMSPSSAMTPRAARTPLSMPLPPPLLFSLYRRNLGTLSPLPLIICLGGEEICKIILKYSQLTIPCTHFVLPDSYCEEHCRYRSCTFPSFVYTSYNIYSCIWDGFLYISKIILAGKTYIQFSV